MNFLEDYVFDMDVAVDDNYSYRMASSGLSDEARLAGKIPVM